MKRAWPWRPSPDGRKPPCRGTGQAIDLAWQQGAVAPVHVVSDGDRAIAAGLQTVYGQEVPHQLCHFHLLREYRRNLGWDGWAEARRLLASESVAEGQQWARRVVALTGGQARYWCRKALRQGLRHLETGTDGFQDHVAAGTAEPRVPATGKDGHGMDAAQPRIKCEAGFVDTAPKARPDQPNHLICNATMGSCRVDSAICENYTRSRLTADNPTFFMGRQCLPPTYPMPSS